MVFIPNENEEGPEDPKPRSLLFAPLPRREPRGAGGPSLARLVGS